MIDFIIKCIQCKSEFNQGNTNKRICESCRMSNYKSQLLISKERQSIKEKEKRKLQRLKKICPICKCEFKTLDERKKYCTKRCLDRKISFTIQIKNKTKQLHIIDEKIINNNIECEKKIIKILNLKDRQNSELEKLHNEYVKKLDFMKSVI